MILESERHFLYIFLITGISSWCMFQQTINGVFLSIITNLNKANKTIIQNLTKLWLLVSLVKFSSALVEWRIEYARVVVDVIFVKISTHHFLSGFLGFVHYMWRCRQDL